MAYRAAAPDEGVVVFDGWIVAHRGLIAAAVAALSASTVFLCTEWRGLGLWLPIGAVSLFALGSTVRRARRLSVRVLPRLGAVLVQERGLGHRVEREVATVAGAALSLDVTRDESWLGQLPAPTLRGTVIRLLTPDGEVPITSRLVGLRRPRAIAEAVRAALALDAPLQVDVARLPRGWPNVRVYTMVATALVVLSPATMLLDALSSLSRGATGRLDLVCTEPCHFQGMDCLPGGSLSSRHEAGEVVVDVVDPAARGGRRAVQVPIAVDHVTRFECTADAVAPRPVPER